MSRQQALARSAAQIDDGALFATLRRRVALPTESRNPARAETLRRYLDEEIRPELEALGFTCMVREHPAARGPFLLARRDEAAGLPTIFSYGHGDVVGGMDRDWHEGLSPWTLQERSGAWYGRGVVDNKGQHTINMAALGAVLRTRGRLGFNAVYLVEMGEEVGSPGLREVCQENREFLAADVLIASDGPRVSAARPTIYLGARGGMSFDLTIEARSGTHHSGNWGGVLSNPGIQLAHAIATITSPTGQIRIPQWVPAQLPDSVRAALADCTVDGGPDGPAIDPAWGEPGLTPAEQIFGWCSFEVLAFRTGNPDAPENAVPGSAQARCQLRFVVGIDEQEILPALRRHLDRQGFPMVRVAPAGDEVFHATRLDPADPWVQWVASRLAEATGKAPAILPNVGGSLPNDIFADLLGMRTIWIPHSYPGSRNHGANEHLPVAIAREGLLAMTGLYWDLGEPAAGLPDRDRSQG